MELKHYAAVLLRWAWLIAACTLAAAAVSYYISMRTPRVYSATTTLMVGQVLHSANPQAGDIATSERLAQSYAQLVRREPVLRATLEALGMDLPLQTLAGQVNAVALPNTQLIQITAIANDPRQAMMIADEVARQLIRQSPTPQEKFGEQQQEFVNQQLAGLQARIADATNQISTLEARLAVAAGAREVQDIQGQIGALNQRISGWQTTYASLLANQEGRTNNISVVDPASTSNVPISPNVPFNIAVASSIGFAVAFGAVVLLEYLDDTIKNTDDMNRVVKLPVLGSLPRITRNQLKHGQLLHADVLTSPVAEAYRVLRTNVHFAMLHQAKQVLLVTSAIPREGKTTAACNLALMMARDGKRVILCDADLRRPSVAGLFGVDQPVGLSTLLQNDELPLAAALLQTPVTGLQLIGSGLTPPNPAELLGGPSMTRRVVQMEQLADVVIFDTPALLPVVDAAVVSRVCNAALLVVETKRTRPGDIKQASTILEQTGLVVLGVVLTNVRGQTARSHYRYYVSGPGRPPTFAPPRESAPVDGHLSRRSRWSPS